VRAGHLKAAADRDKLTDAEIIPVALDMTAPDFSTLPDDFSYVLHAAVDAGTDDWTRCVETNAHNSGELLHHCRTAKGFVFCSTGSIYAYQGRRPLRETDPRVVPLRPNYSVSKIATESVCTWIAKRYRIPLTIIRICSTYGPEGGAPADRLEAILVRKPIGLHSDKPNNYHSIYADDYVELGIRAMEIADIPPVVVNWAGSETVSVEDYCTYMAVSSASSPASNSHPTPTPVVAGRNPNVRGARPHESALARGFPPNGRRPSPRNRGR
jgi:UDP-glucuronate 4-epimerase